MKKLWLSLILSVGLILPISHSPVNHIPVFTPAVVSADTGYIDPNGDRDKGTYVSSGTDYFAAIDDGIRQPTAGGAADYVYGMKFPPPPTPGVDIFNMTTLTGVASVTNVTVWIYGIKPLLDTLPQTCIYMGGTWTTLTNIPINADGPYAWASVSFDGTWTQTDLDNCQVEVKINSSNCYVASMYAVVTYTAGATTTGKVIMISDDGGCPTYNYNYDYLSIYPLTQTDTDIKVTTDGGVNWSSYFATDPSKPVNGDALDNSWRSSGGTVTNQKFNIDYGSNVIVKAIYYENWHDNGNQTEIGVNNFTFYGSNNPDDFSDLVYTDTGDWVELTCSQNTFDRHVPSDVPDPKYITVNNNTSYRFYGFRFSDCYGSAVSMGVRRIELQIDR